MKVILTNQDYEQEKKELMDVLNKLANRGIGVFITYEYSTHSMKVELFELRNEALISLDVLNYLV